MTIATDNVGNSRQMYIISCMNVPKQSQLVQKNEKLLLWCAQVTRCCGGWTSSFEKFISVLRNAPKQLRKTVIKIFSSSLKSKYLCKSINISVPSEWKVLVSLFTNKIVKMLSHVVNITVHSVSITWCKLWQQFGWQLLYWNAEGCASYLCHISISKVQIYTLLYVGYWLKETVSKCLNYWGYGRAPNI